MLIFQKEGYFVFRRAYALSVGLKVKALRNSVSCVKTKTKSNAAVKLAEMLKDAATLFISVNLMNP